MTEKAGRPPGNNPEDTYLQPVNRRQLGAKALPGKNGSAQAWERQSEIPRGYRQTGEQGRQGPVSQTWYSGKQVPQIGFDLVNLPPAPPPPVPSNWRQNAHLEETIYDEIKMDSFSEPHDLIVSDLPGDVSDDMLINYFESKFGDDVEVEEVKFLDSGHARAVVTLSHSAGVKKVLEKATKDRCILKKKEIQVAVYLGGDLSSSSDDYSDSYSSAGQTRSKPNEVCSVEVRGFGGSSEEALELYFENRKKSGGGMVESVTMEGSGAAIVTFKDAASVKGVLAKTEHILEGRKLTVVEHVSSKREVVLKNLPRQVSMETIENYLEAKYKGSVQNVHLNEDFTRALVSFKDDVGKYHEDKDFKRLKDVCANYKLGGVSMEVGQVTSTNCILVSDVPDNCSAETVGYYFENKKRSGGGPVTDVKQCEEEGQFLVYFQDKDVISVVCKKDHFLDSTKLRVQPYQPCLGTVAVGAGQPKIKMPEPIPVPDAEPNKVRFIQNSEKFGKRVEDQMENHHAKMIWPKSQAGMVYIECTLTPKIRGCRELVKAWPQTALGAWNKLLDEFDTETFKVSEEAWSSITRDLSKIDIEDPDAVAVFLEQRKFSITIVGEKVSLRNLCRELKQLIKKDEQEAQKERERVQKTISVKAWQGRYLNACGFAKEMGDKYEKLGVKVDIEQCEVTFEGQRKHIPAAEVDMHDKLNKSEEQACSGLDSELVYLLKNPETETKVRKRFKEKKLEDAWEIKKDDLILHGPTRWALKKMETVIKEELTCMSMTLDKATQDVLRQRDWKEKEKSLLAKFKGCISIKFDKDIRVLVVYVTKDHLDVISEDLQDFFKDHAVYKEEINLKPPIARFMKQYSALDIKTKADKVSDHKLAIDFGKNRGDNKVIVEGDKDGLSIGKKIVQDFERKIRNKKHTFEEPGFGRYMKTEKGKQCVTNTESNCRCVIEIGGKGSEGSGMKTGPQRFTQLTKCATIKLPSGVTITVCGGDMTELQINVIVNAANKDLDHAGGLALEIARKAGQEIEDECNDFIKNNGQLADGEVYMGKPGKLNCKYIAHAVGPVWQGGQNGEEKLLEKAIWTCLEETMKLKQKSIAIPALSAGLFGYPVSGSCEVIVRAVMEFCQKNKTLFSKPLEEVMFIDVSPRTVQEFITALNNANSGKVNILEMVSGSKPPPKHKPSRDETRSPSEERSSSSPQSSEVVFGRTKVSVVKGEMANETVDMLVNSTAAELKLHQGIMSRTLLKAAGQAMQDEVTQKYPQGINTGEIAVSGGGRLKCKLVAHCVLPTWHKAGGKDATKDLQNVMYQCLKEADKNQLKSVSFPAFGTGFQKFPKDLVAHEMFQSIHKFCSKSKTSLTFIRMVIFPTDTETFEAFQSEEQQWLQGRPAPGGRRPHTSTSHGDDGRDQGATGGAINDKGEFQLKRLKVLIYKGDISAERTDGIVCSSNKDLDLSKGAASKAILNKGGSDLAEACKRERDTMRSDGIAVTPGGSLKCRYIVHIASYGAAQDWQSPVYDCIKKAEEFKMATLSIPALGTAKGCKPDDICEVIYKAITGYQSKHAVRHLKEIRVVIFQGDMLPAFLQKMQMCTGGAVIRPDTGATSTEGEQQERHRGHRSRGRSAREREKEAFELSIYADSDHNIRSAIKKIEETMKSEWIIKEESEEAFSNLRRDQIESIKKEGNGSNVMVNIEKDNGCIRLEGLTTDVFKVSDKVHQIIRQLDKSQYESKHAKLMKNMVKWFFLQGQKQREFQDRDNLLIETAFQAKEQSVKLRDRSGGQYQIDFSSMKETDLKTNATLPVIRRDLLQDAGGSLDIPKHWAPMKPDSNLLVVALKQGDPEYQKVVGNFSGSAGRNYTVVNVERIQNRPLYAQYVAKKKQMEVQNGKKNNERVLWHGTADNAVQSINYHGFNRSYCGKNAVAIGNGVYFAVGASYSAQSTYSPADRNGHKRMYSTLVLTGEYTQGGGGMRVPPAKKGQILYDSVTDNPSGPNMFVIFNDTQAYPEYLITFK